MKVLLHSNAPWAPTGYGVQTAIFARRIRDLGHDVAISAFFGLQGGLLTWQGMTVYPAGNAAYGNDVLPLHAAAHFGEEPGVVLLLADAWVIQPQAVAGLNVLMWTPVDHEPAQPPSVRMLHATGVIPIAMSRHGERMLRAEGLDPFYVPHGIETAQLYPGDKAEARAKLTIPPGAFLVGMVAANKGNAPVRKSWPQALQAFARFQKKRPESILYLHTDGMGVFNGVNLFEMVEAFGIPQQAVRFCNQYRYNSGFAPEYMRDIYTAMDVLLSPSMGEGFGVPIVEAQACGTPVIVTDWTAMPELVGAGWKVGGEKTWTPLGSWMLTPYVHEIVDALDRAYRKRDDADLQAKAAEFALRYDADAITTNCWKPILDGLAT